jgi:hypothetical protein
MQRSPSVGPGRDVLLPTATFCPDRRRLSLANLPARTAASLATAVKNRLERMQYRQGLIDGYLTGTGLSPPTPTRL